MICDMSYQVFVVVGVSLAARNVKQGSVILRCVVISQGVSYNGALTLVLLEARQSAWFHLFTASALLSSIYSEYSMYSMSYDSVAGCAGDRSSVSRPPNMQTATATATVAGACKLL